MLFRALFGDYIKLPEISDPEYNNHVSFWNDLALNSQTNIFWDFGLKPFYKSKQNTHSLKAFKDISNWFIKFEKEYNKNKDKNGNEIEPLIATLMKKGVKKYNLYSDCSTVLIARYYNNKVIFNMNISNVMYITKTLN